MTKWLFKAIAWDTIVLIYKQWAIEQRFYFIIKKNAYRRGEKMIISKNGCELSSLLSLSYSNIENISQIKGNS